MATAYGDITWRDLLLVRLMTGFLALFAAVVAVASIVVQPSVWVAYVVLLVPLGLGPGLRRRCTLSSTELDAVGRFTRRRMPLTELQQVGLSRTRVVWVQTHDGQVSLLRMIPVAKGLATGQGGSADAVDTIRTYAQHAGADLEPPLDGPTRPPTTRPTVFSV